MTDVKAVQMSGLGADAPAATDPMAQLKALAAQANAKAEEEASANKAAESLETELVGSEVEEEEEVEESFDLPRLLLLPTKKGGPWTLQLFAQGCLDCNSLVPGGETEGEELPCHFSKGINDSCPAETFKVKFIGPVILVVRKYRKLFAKSEGKALQTARLYSELMSDLMNYQEDEIAEIMKQLGLLN